jgi:hypothetical protein
MSAILRGAEMVWGLDVSWIHRRGYTTLYHLGTIRRQQIFCASGQGAGTSETLLNSFGALYYVNNRWGTWHTLELMPELSIRTYAA